MEETIYIRNNGSDMPAFIYGNGASKVFILLLHGGPGGNGLDYRLGKFKDKLEEKYAMVYWDQRHQGNSHGHLSQNEVTIDAMVEDTYVLVQTLKQRYGSDISVFLMGHSWGGTLGTAYMIKDDYQEELAGWIEVDGAHDIPMLNVEVVKMILDIGEDELAAGNNVSNWQEILDYVNEIDTNNITDQQADDLNTYAHEIEALLPQLETHYGGVTFMDHFFFSPSNPFTSATSGATLPASFETEMLSASMTDDLNKITIPTLLQWGKYDFVVPPSLGYSAYDKISSTDKYLKIYENSAHSPMDNEPDLFAQDVIDFVEAHK